MNYYSNRYRLRLKRNAILYNIYLVTYEFKFVRLKLCDSESV